jgi:hypothetical protein
MGLKVEPQQTNRHMRIRGFENTTHLKDKLHTHTHTHNFILIYI